MNAYSNLTLFISNLLYKIGKEKNIWPISPLTLI